MRIYENGIDSEKFCRLISQLAKVDFEHGNWGPAGCLMTLLVIFFFLPEHYIEGTVFENLLPDSLAFLTALMVAVLLIALAGLAWEVFAGAGSTLLSPKGVRALLEMSPKMRKAFKSGQTALVNYQVYVSDSEVGFALKGQPVDWIEWFYLPEARTGPTDIPTSPVVAELLDNTEIRIERDRRAAPRVRLSSNLEIDRRKSLLRVQNPGGPELCIPSFFPLDEIEAELERRTA